MNLVGFSVIFMLTLTHLNFVVVKIDYFINQLIFCDFLCNGDVLPLDFLFVIAYNIFLLLIIN